MRACAKRVSRVCRAIPRKGREKWQPSTFVTQLRPQHERERARALLDWPPLLGATQALEQVEQFAPGLLAARADVRFHLLCLSFAQLVAAGDGVAALQFARTHLRPFGVRKTPSDPDYSDKLQVRRHRRKREREREGERERKRERERGREKETERQRERERERQRESVRDRDSDASEREWSPKTVLARTALMWLG